MHVPVCMANSFKGKCCRKYKYHRWIFFAYRYLLIVCTFHHIRVKRKMERAPANSRVKVYHNISCSSCLQNASTRKQTLIEKSLTFPRNKPFVTFERENETTLNDCNTISSPVRHYRCNFTGFHEDEYTFFVQFLKP